MDSGDPAGPVVWERSHRYSDQPLNWRTRAFGAGGVMAVALLIAVATLVSWMSWQAAPPNPTLSVFDVAAPAAPPEPELPPSPEAQEKEKPMSAMVEQKPVPEPRVVVPALNAVPPPQTDPDPSPPVQDAAVPERKPAPPAPKVSDDKPTWQGEVLAALNKERRYPREAVRARRQGVPYVRVVMDREGRVLSATLEKSSGVTSLDAEAVALPRRASPLPKPPEEVPGTTLELVVPVEFFLGQRL